MEQTRGVTGFFCNEPMLVYQNADAEPEKLGINILNEIKGIDESHRKNPSDFLGEHVLEQLVSVNETDPATGNHKKHFRRHLPSDLVREDARTIYALFEPVQGTIKPYIDGLLDFYPNGNDFVKDSHFCKWGYVLNADNGQFEILRGDQTDIHDEPPVYGIGGSQPIGVYDCKDMPYCACKIIHSYDLTDLPPEDQFLADLKSK